MAVFARRSLLASQDEMTNLHRIVVRVGAAAAWFAAGVYLALGLFGDIDSSLVQALGPVLAASLMTLQIMTGREDGGIALFGSGLIVAIWYTAFGTEATAVPAAVSLVLIASLGMLFVDRMRHVTALAIAACLGLLPVLWQGAVPGGLAIGAIMAGSFLITDFILNAIKSGARALTQRYEVLFRDSPTAALEEDWSEAIEYVHSEYTGKQERVRDFLKAYPAVVRNAVSRAKVVRVNEAALDLLGIDDATSFLGYRSPGVLVDENLETFVDAIASLYSGRRQWEREFPMTTSLGETRWIHARAVDTSVAPESGSIVVALADVTHIRENHDAMEELVRAKDDFIASVSHEIRTPLTAVIGLASELAENPDMDSRERAELIGVVADQAAEMGNIVEDLLVAARIDRGTVSVERGSVQLSHELQVTAEGLGVRVDMPAFRAPQVAADPRRVRQIFRNLLTNAARYGGPRVRALTGTAGSIAWIEIRDNGSGVPPEQAAKIFEPYATGTNGIQGSVGLGLAVARQLAELMEGTLTYERSGSESIFKLALPLTASPARSMASQAVRP